MFRYVIGGQCGKDADIPIFPCQSVTISPGWQLCPVNIYCGEVLEGGGGIYWTLQGI